MTLIGRLLTYTSLGQTVVNDFGFVLRSLHAYNFLHATMLLICNAFALNSVAQQVQERSFESQFIRASAVSHRIK